MALQLVEVHKGLSAPTAGAFYEVMAAKYVKIDIAEFRELVRKGKILARAHSGRTRCIYLKEDLDDYLRNLPPHKPGRVRIASGEVPQEPPEQEASSGT